MSARRQVDLVLVGVLAALGGLGFVAVFRQEDLVRPVVVGAAAGVAVSLAVTGLARRRAGTTLVVALPVLAAAAIAGCGIDPGSLLSGLRDGPRTILTSAVPAPDRPELVLVPYVAVALAALLSAELAQRSRLAVAPVLPPVAVFAVGLAFGGEGRLPPLWIPTAWVLVAAVLTGWRAGGSDAEADVPVVRGAHSRSRGRSRLLAPGLPSLRAVAMVVLVAVPLAGCARWLGPRLPGADQRERFDLRGLVDQPVQTQEVANPLVAVTAWQDGPDDPLFGADTSGQVDRWRLAVLDAYDGIEWRSAAGFVAAGPDLPGPLVTDASADGGGDDGDGGDGGAGEVATQEVTGTVEPTGLGGRWLPVIDRAVEVSASDTLFDRAGGVLLVDGAELPSRYTVRAAVPEPDPDRLVGAGVATDEEAQAALALPDGVPDDVGVLAEEVVQGTGSAYARAAAIERFLAASPDVPYELATEELPSGHSIGHLRCFLFATERCGRRGSTEQFVAAYALLARSAGLPTRVVVGFAAGPSSGPAEVSAHDATAWAEVKLAGVGWVAFDPVPDPNVEITPPTTGVAGATAPPVPQPPTSVDQGADEGAAPQPDIPTAPEAGGDGPGTLLLVVGVGVAAGLLVLALPALWRGRRRRRRQRAGTPAGRIVGAWAAALDELAATGADVTRAMAVADVVRTGRTRLGPAAEALGPLGLLVNRSHFAAGLPAEGDAQQAWTLSDRFRAERRKGRPLARRLREYLIVRSSA